MTRNRILLIVGISAAVVGLAAAGAMAQRSHFWGHQGHGWRHSGGGMSFLGLGGGRPLHDLCRRDPAEMADHMIVGLEHKVKPTEAQQPAFAELKSALKSAAAKMNAACPKDAATGDEEVKVTPIERLAQAEVGLEASLDAVKTMRPAAEKFYAALSDEQKAKLDKVRNARHWRKGPRGADDDGAKDPEGGPSQRN